MPRVPGSTKKPTAIRRREILDAAKDTIREHGLIKMTTRVVAEKVGVAQPTFFIHFKSKAELIAVIVDETGDALSAGLKALNLDEKPPEDALRALIVFHFGFVHSQPCLPRILFSEDLQNDNPELKKKMDKFVKSYLTTVQNIITRGCESGAFRQNSSPRQQARIIISTFQGLAYRWLLDGFSGELEKNAVPVADQLLMGLLNKPSTDT